jgi:uncharacterized protein involved in response to NO
MIAKPLSIEASNSPVKPAPSSFALWSLGFRPFYLLAGIFAAVSIPLWICQYTGYLPAAYVRGPVWHAHEMLFGYTLAVITGFLFTAVRNWTGHSTPSGTVLAAYALLWIAGRILVYTPYDVASTMVNAAFPVAVAVGIGIPLARSANTRNYFFIAILLFFGLATLALHLSFLGILDWTAVASLQVGLDLVLFVMAVMGGRVIPMFTNNGVPGTKATRLPVIEKVALGSIVALLGADLFQASGGILAAIALVAVAAHATRLYLWQPWRTLRVPMVWVLHAAYAWIVIHFALRAAAALGLFAEPLAVHALTIGGIGGLTMGMMTRTSRGHTGRPLIADRFEVACFLLVFCAAVIRVFGGMILPDAYVATVIGSGICWSAGFALFAFRYWPVLSRSRLDGKPG